MSNHQTGSKNFILTKKEIQFYQRKWFDLPTKCKPCIEFKKNFKDQICKCKVCHRTQKVEAHKILKKTDEFSISLETFQKEFECNACIDQGLGWYPRDNAWINKGPHKYQYKMSPDNVITDKLFASPKFTDQEAHDMHVHFWNLDQGDSHVGAGFSFKEGFVAPTIIHVLSECGLELGNNFKPNKGKIKLKCQNESDKYDIGIQNAMKFLEVWKNQ